MKLGSNYVYVKTYLTDSVQLLFFALIMGKTTLRRTYP